MESASSKSANLALSSFWIYPVFKIEKVRTTCKGGFGFQGAWLCQLFYLEKLQNEPIFAPLQGLILG
jgi:hypothetical protein